MAEKRDLAFHPSSPPSEGGADSFRYEDTPDTRLTTFSPLDSESSGSSRLLNSLSLSTGKGAEKNSKSQNPSTTIHNKVSVESLNSVIHDQDPFITSAPERSRNQVHAQTNKQTHTKTKLSATASAFHPLVTTPLIANGVSNGLATPKPLGRARHGGTIPQSPNTGLRIYSDVPLSPSFSHELNLSRSIRITSTSGNVTHGTIKEHLNVCSPGINFRPMTRLTRSQNLSSFADLFGNDPAIFTCRDGAYLRFSNIRDAMKFLSHSGAKPMDWKIEAISAQEINKARHSFLAQSELRADNINQGTGIDILATENEGLHNLIVYPIAPLTESQIQDGIREHFKHYDIFALTKQSTSFVDDTLRWVMEWSDIASTWACAMHLYNRGWVDVSYNSCSPNLCLS